MRGNLKQRTHFCFWQQNKHGGAAVGYFGLPLVESRGFQGTLADTIATTGQVTCNRLLYMQA